MDRYLWFLLILFFIHAPSTIAHEGFFIKLNVGSGTTEESLSLNDSGTAQPAKNHMVGWGLIDSLAIMLSDSGSLTKMKVGAYDYINLDAFIPGVVIYLPFGFSGSYARGNAQVAFAHEWTEASGDNITKGTATNMYIEKEWVISEHWAFGIGVQRFNFTTKNPNYDFETNSINLGFNYYYSGIK